MNGDLTAEQKSEFARKKEEHCAVVDYCNSGRPQAAATVAAAVDHRQRVDHRQWSTTAWSTTGSGRPLRWVDHCCGRPLLWSTTAVVGCCWDGHRAKPLFFFF
ncbi:hypothetical protein Adt_49051 [Abeliophyllum distichum]|uniref:Uncharacterized protein n=1 Tax=Abeliophyllum distichum TaxID=126358 RepID=A0ABD1NQ06_9LAMI